MSVRDELIGLIEADAGIDEECAAEVLDALLADPSAVLAELENADCQTCGGARVALQFGATRPGDESTCRACGGSGKLGRDGVLRLLGVEQVGWRGRDDEDLVPMAHGNPNRPKGFRWRPVFALVPVPEPSEGPPKLPADHSLCDLPCDLPDEAHDG